ncbi:22183_t:CDS:2, partial [Cetraspora pellucida]
FTSTKYDNPVNSDNNDEHYNLTNSDHNTVPDMHNNLINDTHNNLIIEESSILPNNPNNISNLPNLKKIKLVPITKHSERTIKSLVAVLEPFAEATDLLGDSKYTTISFIYSAINAITNNLILTDDLELWEVNYKDDKNIFDDTNLNENQTDNTEFINLQN